MSRVNPRVLFGVGVPLVVVLLVLAVFAIDSSRYTGKVPRNVRLAEHDIGGMSEDELARTVSDLANEYEGIDVRIRARGAEFESTAGALGLQVEKSATVDGALTMNRRVNVFMRPITWLNSFITPRQTELHVTVDRKKLEAEVQNLAGNISPTEPEIVIGTEGLAVIDGQPGRTIAADGIAEQLLRKAKAGDSPIVVDATMSETSPTVSDAEAQDFANLVNASTENGLTVVAGDHETSFDAATVRNWLTVHIGDEPELRLADEDAVQTAVEAAIGLDTSPVDAQFDVVDDRPVVTPGKNGEVCCGDDTPERVLEAIDAGRSKVEVEIEVKKPRVSEEDIDDLGIVERVGSVTEWAGVTQDRSFTTYHAPGESRVTNIHLIADAARGTVILPGEQFSMNGVVGERTAEKGYVAAGAIRNGKTVDEIGGGVSQFATTMFNAAYYAGLQIDKYQAHSEHFSRYPRGREATMGFPEPDLVWTNNSPHAILIWTSYTDTSVTVTFYSTQWATAEQVDSTESRSGNCTIVTTTREVTYPDGRTANDQFRATYRDKNQTSC